MCTELPATSPSLNVSLAPNSTISDTGDSIYYICVTYVYRIIYVVGLLGNIFAFVVWARSGLKVSPVTYFQAICVADSFVLIMHALETFHSVHVQGVCQLVHVLFLAVQVFAIFLVLGLSLERFIDLCRPLSSEMIITYARTVRTILGLAGAAVLASLFEAYLWHVDPAQGQCVLRHTTSQGFMWTYAVLVLVVLFLCPLTLVVVFNILVATRIRKRRRNSYAYSVAMVPDRHKMNVSFMLISLYLAICEIVYAFVYITQYFVPERHAAAAGGHSEASSSSGGGEAVTSGLVYAGNKSSMPLTGRWHSYYVKSGPLLIVDVLALTSYAVDLTIFTLCSKTFRRAVRDLFQRYKRRKSLIMGYREPLPY